MTRAVADAVWISPGGGTDGARKLVGKRGFGALLLPPV